jgi:hypothetical protein
MKLDEARELKVGDTVFHIHFKTEWEVVEVHPIKSNPARFRHILKLSWRKYTFTEKGLHLWTKSLDT